MTLSIRGAVKPSEGFLCAELAPGQAVAPGLGGRLGGEANGAGPTLLAQAQAGLCRDLPPLPTLLIPQGWAGRRESSTGAADAPALSSQALLCTATRCLTDTFTLFMVSALELFLSCFPFVFSAVLS